MQDVETIRCRVRDQKEFLEKRKERVLNSIDKATDEVHRVAENWISLIRQHQSTMTKELLEQKKNFQAAFSTQITSLDEKLIEIDSSLEFGKDVLERKNLPEIVNIEEILERRFQELSLTSEVRFMLNYPTVKYVPSDAASSINHVLRKLCFIDIEPSLTIARGKGLTDGTEGEDCSFTIITRDFQGQSTYCEFDKVNVDIQSLETGNITKPKISDTKSGRYEVKYKPEAAGEFSVSITVGSEAIPGSPFQLQVKERMRKSKGRKGFLKRESSGSQSKLQATRLNCDLCKYVHTDLCDQLSCGHHFCKSCQKSAQSLACCPVCDAVKDSIQVLTGNQPNGHMSWRNDPENSLSGFQDCGTVIISCNFERGVQGPEHPNPGVPYRCFSCTFYLPDNREGRDLCILLRRAFNTYLMFTIAGSSSSTGAENSIVCNGLELKTSRSGGPAKCGYPDPSYLYRLKKQLAEKGIK